jgi:nitroreductase
MDVFEAVRTMLAVRRYQDRPVPEPVLRRILEAGRLTASAMNNQPWHFVAVQDRAILRRLGALARTGSHVAQAALAIVVAVDRTPFAVSDASRAIQSMLQRRPSPAATSRGRHPFAGAPSWARWWRSCRESSEILASSLVGGAGLEPATSAL